MKVIQLLSKGYDLPARQVLSLFCCTRLGSLMLWYDTWRARFLLWRFGARVGGSLTVSGRLRVVNRGGIVIGDQVRVNSGPRHNFVGGDRRTNVWVGRGAKLEIGEKVALSNSTIVAMTRIHIKEGTFIGGGCDIYDSDFHELDPANRACRTGSVGSAAVEIGPRAFVGGHSIILKGVTIGEGAVIGAGSVVTKSVPPFEIWAGCPAQFIRKLRLPAATDSR